MKLVLGVLLGIVVLLGGQTVAAPTQQPKKAKVTAGKKVSKPVNKKGGSANTSSTSATTAGDTNYGFGRVPNIVWNETGTRIVIADSEHKVTSRDEYHIYMWDCKESDPTMKTWRNKDTKVEKAHRDYITFIQYSVGRKWLYSGSYDRTIKIWDPTNGASKQTIKFDFRPRDLTVTPDGNAVIVTPINVFKENYNHMYLMPLDNEIPRQRNAIRMNHGETIRHITFHPGTGRLFSIGYNWTLEWQLGNPNPVRKMDDSELHFAYFVKGVNPPLLMKRYTRDPVLKFTAANGGQFNLTTPTTEPGDLIGPTFSPDGTRIACRFDPDAPPGEVNQKAKNNRHGRQLKILIWEHPFNSPQVINSFHGKFEISDLEFLDSQTLITCGYDGRVKTLNLNTKAIKEVFSVKEPALCRSLKLSLDRKKVAVVVGGTSAMRGYNIMVIPLK